MTERLGGSFRDPSGFVFERDGVLYRQVNESFREPFDMLTSSGLYDALVAEHLLVPHSEEGEPAAPGAYKVIRPKRVPFVSYPYEWCFSALKEAALATMRIQSMAIERGMWLRDATAYNIQFAGGKPALIDTLSFEPIREGSPWPAYRQFCQHFLAPLALVALRDHRMGLLSRDHVDGVPLDMASALLPRRTRYRPGLGLHVHMHAKSQRRNAGKDVRAASGSRRMSPQALRGLMDSLAGAVRRLEYKPADSAWTGYYASKESYADESLEHKVELVGKFLGDLNPKTVWDLGANTGMFSRLAASRGAQAVAFEMDYGCTEMSWREMRSKGEEGVLPLVLDLTNPSPAIGWGNRERMTLAERGPADVVMALALIHHLAIANNVPLGDVARTFRALGKRLIVEWVPKQDPMVKVLLSSREDIFPGYTQEGFERAFGEVFTLERKEEIRGSERTLYLYR